MPWQAGPTAGKMAANLDRFAVIKIEGSGSNVNANAYESVANAANATNPFLLFGPDTMANVVQWIRNNLTFIQGL